jgi:predicted RNA-binding protein with PUA-like domain
MTGSGALGRARWLLKEEPTHYSFGDLVRDGTVEWDGVRNALALRHLRSFHSGDDAFFYQSGSVRAIVGVVRVASDPHPAPDGGWSVTVVPVRALRRPVPLAELRVAPQFAGSPLLRMSRLSVMPIRSQEWQAVLSLETAPPVDVRSHGPIRGGGGLARAGSGDRPRRVARNRRRRATERRVGASGKASGPSTRRGR